MDYYRSTPEIRSLADAIAVVREIIAEMQPWPEKVEVGDPAEVPSMIVFHVSGEQRFTLSCSAYSKARAIATGIRQGITMRRAGPRMPELAIVIGDAVTWIWDERIGQIITESGEEAE
jgi:hypothetical protein